MKQSHTYAIGGFEETYYNRCVGSYLSSYRPFSSNLQQLVTPKNAVKKWARYQLTLEQLPGNDAKMLGKFIAT